jgi:hypothetical protein
MLRNEIANQKATNTKAEMLRVKEADGLPEVSTKNGIFIPLTIALVH